MQSQVEQEHPHGQPHYQPAPLREAPLHDSSPSRDDDEAEQEAGPPQKRHGGDILSQLRTESSQLLPHTSSPSAQHQQPMSLAELKAEMQAGSATKRGWAHAPLSTCQEGQLIAPACRGCGHYIQAQLNVHRPQQTPRSRQPKQAVRRKASLASPSFHSSGRRRQQTPSTALRTPRRVSSLCASRSARCAADQQPANIANSQLRQTLLVLTLQADGSPGPVMSMNAALSMLRSQPAPKRPLPQARCRAALTKLH